MYKKFIAAAAAVTMLLGAGVAAGGNVVADVFSISAGAADTDYTRELNDDGTVTITKYTGSETNVVIPSTLGGRKVTKIGSGAFSKSSIQSVTIPDSVVEIVGGNSKSAFYQCTSLESVILGKGLKKIGNYTFYGCSNLKKITIPSSVTEIGQYVFKNCTSLTDIVIPDSVTSLDNNGYALFSGCTNLKTVKLGKGVTTIGDSCFSGCSNLTSITLTNNITSIGGSAFKDCTSLESISIPNTVISIGMYAFQHCDSLTSINIPASVTSIGSYAFDDCDNLSKVTLNEGMKTINNYAFRNCPNLKEIIIPKSVTSLEQYSSGHSFGYIGSNKVDGFKIHCYADTAAEEYAMKYGFDYDIHSFGAWITTKEASYTSAGQQTRKCKTCSLTETKTIAKKTLAQVKSKTEYTNATDAIRVNWNKVTGAEGYIVERSTDGKTWTRVARIANANTLNYRNAGLKSGTKYLYRVKAFVIENGVAYYSDYSSTITAWTKPAAPKAKTEYTYATDAVRVNWNKSTGADGYIVERSTDGKTWTRVARIADANTLNYRNSGLKSGTKYLYRVKAFTIKNSVVSYSPYSATITAATKPAATKITKNTKATTAVRLYWNKVSCTGYKIQQYKNGSWVTIKKVAMGTTEYRVEGLKKNTSYKFRIQPYYSVNGKILYGAVSATYTAKTTS